jgi:hypothetical protein
MASLFIASGLERAYKWHSEDQDATDIVSSLWATHSVSLRKSRDYLGGRRE